MAKPLVIQYGGQELAFVSTRSIAPRFTVIRNSRC